MRTPKVKWKAEDDKMAIAVFETGNHYAVREFHKDTGEMLEIMQSFSEMEARLAFDATLELRRQAILSERDALRRPAEPAGILKPASGKGGATDLRNPFIAELLEDYRAGNRIASGDPLSDKQRREFDRMVIEFLSPGLPEQIKNFTRMYGA